MPAGQCPRVWDYAQSLNSFRTFLAQCKKDSENACRLQKEEDGEEVIKGKTGPLLTRSPHEQIAVDNSSALGLANDYGAAIR